MERKKINEIDSTFFEIYGWIKNNGGIKGLVTTGGTQFNINVGQTKDGRLFLSLPHSNRVYENDWGYRNNSMGKDGQRIGQYCLSIHQEYQRQEET